MKRQNVAIALFLCVTLSLGAQPKPPSSTPNQAPPKFSIDTNQIQDQNTKNIVTKIDRILSRINTYSCERTITSVMSKGIMENKEVRCYKKTGFSYCKSTNTRHFIPLMKGNVSYHVIDGKTGWLYTKNAPGTGKLLLESMKGKMPKEKQEVMIKNHEQPKIFKWDINRLLMAGMSAQDIVSYGILLNPFSRCDMAELKLESEDAQSWIFIAKPKSRNITTITTRIKINKQNGIAEQFEYRDKKGKNHTTEKFSNVKINPVFPENQFTFQPPPGIPVKDETTQLINSRKQIQKLKKR